MPIGRAHRPDRDAATVAGGTETRTSGSTVALRTLTNVGAVTIPAGYTGDIEVTVTDWLGENTRTLTLNVDTLESVIGATTAAGVASDVHQSRFVIDGMVWRVLSKQMGTTGHGAGGTDILILSEFAVSQGYWNSSPITTGGYAASFMRTDRLTDFYASQTWAHNVAVLPGSSTGTTGFGTFDAIFNLTEVTTSTGIMMSTRGDNLDGAFLLSQGDVVNANFGFSTGTAAHASRVARLQGTQGGTAWWLRTPDSHPMGVRNVSTAGIAFSMGFASNLTETLRPALIINLGS